MTARRSAFLEARSAETQGARRANSRSQYSCGPTRCPPAQRRNPQRSRLSAVHRCARLRPHACARWRTTARCASGCCGRSSTGPSPHRSAKSARNAGAVRSVLCEWQARPLLAAYGIGVGRRTARAFGDEAEAAAQAIGRPVALKVQSADIPHKTEAGAVALDLAGADAVRAAYDRVLAAAKKHHAPTRASTACWCSRWRRPGAKSFSASIATRTGA